VDLVEEQRAARGELEQPRLGPFRIGERPGFEAEELRLEHRLGDGRAVHVDKRGPAARSALMHDAGDETLARAGLTEQQHRRDVRVGRRIEHRQPSDLFPQGDHRRVGAEDRIGGMRVGAHGPSHKPLLAQQPPDRPGRACASGVTGTARRLARAVPSRGKHNLRGGQMEQAKVEAFVHKALGDIGSALTASLVVIGDKLGLYRAMAGAGALTSEELAARTGTSERCVREWLAAQAAAGYVEHDETTGRYTLPDEHALALTDDDSPACVLGGFQGMTAAMRAAPKVTDAFRTGRGVGWHEHDPELFIGVERFFRPGYNANLVTSWIPALD